MNVIKTNFEATFDNGNSFIIYITNTHEEAMNIHEIHMANKSILPNGWYYVVQTASVQEDCRIPKFFHGKGYFATIITHNKGNWNDKNTSYELYIVE